MNWDLVLEQLDCKLNILESNLRERERWIDVSLKPTRSISEQPDYM